MANTSLAKVWPLRSGIRGCNALGKPIMLQPGSPGWMPIDEARKLEKEGALDIMAGKTPGTLRKPVYDVQAVVAESPPEPTPEPSLAPEPKTEPEPAKAPPRRSTKKRYSRRDLQAEKS